MGQQKLGNNKPIPKQHEKTMYCTHEAHAPHPSITKEQRRKY
jgi:hypothetical protein